MHLMSIVNNWSASQAIFATINTSFILLKILIFIICCSVCYLYFIVLVIVSFFYLFCYLFYHFDIHLYRQPWYLSFIFYSS